MIHLVYSPEWFYGKDIVIDLVSIFTLFLIAFFSLRYYKVKENKNYLYLASSFSLIGVAFIFKIIMNFTIYYDIINTNQVGDLTWTYKTLQVDNTPFFVGFLLYRLLTIIGFYLLYQLYNKQTWRDNLLVIYLILVAVYFTESAYYMFHLTLFVLISLVIFGYFKNPKEEKRGNNILGISFYIIALSELISMFIKFDSNIYVISELIQLIGYLGILITFILVLINARKKNKN